MEAIQTETRALQSEAIIWWPWSAEEYQGTMMSLNQVASHEGISVEMTPIEDEVILPDGSSLPIFCGFLISVWSIIIAQSDGHVDSPEDDVLSRFKTRRCDDTDQDEEEVCCICLDDLYRGSVTTLNCRHEFHPDCIRRWLVHGQNFCPLCKAPAIR